MNDNLIATLVKDMNHSDDPRQLRFIGEQLEKLSQYDLAASAFRKADKIEKEAAQHGENRTADTDELEEVLSQLDPHVADYIRETSRR